MGYQKHVKDMIAWGERQEKERKMTDDTDRDIVDDQPECLKQVIKF